MVILCCVAVHWLLEVGNNHQRPDLFHYFDQLFGGGPLVTGLKHVSADFAVGADIGMVNFCFEGDDWSLEGEVGELEFELEVASDKWAFLGACDVDGPEVVLLDNNNKVPDLLNQYSFSSSMRSLLSLGADILVKI